MSEIDYTESFSTDHSEGLYTFPDTEAEHKEDPGIESQLPSHTDQLLMPPVMLITRHLRRQNGIMLGFNKKRKLLSYSAERL